MGNSSFKLTSLNLNGIRSATNKAWVLGDPDFVAEVEAQLNRRALPRARGGDRRSAAYREAQAEALAQAQTEAEAGLR